MTLLSPDAPIIHRLGVINRIQGDEIAVTSNMAVTETIACPEMSYLPPFCI